MSNARLVIFDAMNLIRRVYAVHQQHRDALDTACNQTVQIIRNCIKQQAATHAVAVFDGLQPNWRKQLYPLYKANRQPIPAELLQGLDRFQHEWQAIGVEAVIPESDEADDVIATLAVKAASRLAVTIVSTDQGYYQILGSNIDQWDPFSRQLRDTAFYQDKFSVGQQQWPDYRALTGESSSNIPGVSGIGPKSAVAYLQQGIEALTEKQRANLQRFENRLELFAVMTRLHTDRELDFNLNMLRVSR